jgi:predicted nucleic acid-binding protein
MTPGDAEAVFLDTNILVYAQMRQAPWHQEARHAILTREQAGVPLWISRQVLREYLAVLTRPQTWTTPPPRAELLADVRTLERRFHVADDTAQVTAQLLTLLVQMPVGGRQVHDANIIAAMLTHGVSRLLTHNTTDFTRFQGLITVLPLLPPPA